MWSFWDHHWADRPNGELALFVWLICTDESSNTRVIIQGQSPLTDQRQPRDEAVGDVEGLDEKGSQIGLRYPENCDQLEDLRGVTKNHKWIVRIEG